MVEEYVMQDNDFPEIEKQLESSEQKKCYEQSMREMVNKFPAMFAGKRWDKWRDKNQEEPENDISKQPVGRETDESWREQRLREYGDIPF